MIVAGRAVCTSCMESQALEDCESPFSHADACVARDQESQQPWVALHLSSTVPEAELKLGITFSINTSPYRSVSPLACVPADHRSWSC